MLSRSSQSTRFPMVFFALAVLLGSAASSSRADSWSADGSPTYVVDTSYSMQSGTITSSLGTTYGTYGDGSTTTANATSTLSGTNFGAPPPAMQNSMFGGLGQTQMTVTQTYYWFGPDAPTPAPVVNFSGSVLVTISDIYETGTSSITAGSSNVSVSNGSSSFTPTPTTTVDPNYNFKAYGVATLGSTAGSTGGVDGSHSASSTTTGVWGDPV